MSRKSILFVITKSAWGGATKYVFDLSANLPKDKYQTAVAAGGRGELTRKLLHADISYYDIANFQRNISFLKEFLAFFEILGLLFRLRPDIIHANSSKAGGLTGLAGLIYKIFSFKKVSLVFTAHGWAFAENRPQREIKLIKFFSKLACLFYDKIICVSEYDRQIALNDSIAPTSKLSAIHNGLDPKEISLLPREIAQRKLIGETSPFVIGTIAEWTANKGLGYFFEALDKINLKHDQFKVILIGSGENPDREKMHALVQEKSLTNVHLIEFVPDAANYLKAFDIFFLCSLKEGFPYAILEAMLARCTIVATRVGGIPEMITDGQEGLLIEPKNSQQLTDKINLLIADAEKRKALAQNARARVLRDFSLKKMAEETKKVYSNLPAKTS